MKRTKTSVMAGLLLAGSGMPAAAETMDEWLSGDYATGDWGGMRTQLEEMGITPEITYTTDILTLLKGGVDDGNGSSYAGRAELNLNFDLEKLFGLQGSRFYIEGAWSSGQDISARHIGNLFPRRRSLPATACASPRCTSSRTCSTVKSASPSVG